MLRVLIVDDEAPARQRLRKLLEPLEEEDRLDVVGEADEGEQALHLLDEHPVDLMFLDIRMPGLDGFDVLEQIPPGDRPVIVFTTAYDAYALRAFEANAVDYLLKPIAQERLNEAVSRAERIQQSSESQRLSSERLSKLLDWIDTQAEAQAEEEALEERAFIDQISIPFRDRILIVPVERLVSAEIEEGITRLFVIPEDDDAPKTRLRQHVVNYTLDELQSNLDPHQFMRVHRSSIVHLRHIKEMIPWFSGRYKLMLTGDHEVIASRDRSKRLKDRLLL